MNYLQSHFKLFLFIRERVTTLATALLILLSALLFLSIANVYPSILGDEFIYATQATVYGPYQESSYGSATSFAFDFLFSATSLCGPSFFYLCGKLLNVGLLFSLALYVFLFLRRSTSNSAISILVSSLILVSPWPAMPVSLCQKYFSWLLGQ
jgi:hypothetical protein